MSRAHMLYDDTAMSALPVKITDYNHGRWDPDRIFQLEKGNGYIIEAKILGKSKHGIVDGIEHKAVRRRFDGNGQEIEPDFGSEKKVNTGYLMSSYKNVSKEGEDVVSPVRMKNILKNEELDRILDGRLSSYSGESNVSAVWCIECQMEGIEIPNGVVARLRTKGDNCYMDSIICLDEEWTSKVNYTTGKPVGGSWTDKVLQTKDEKAPGAHLTQDSKAVDDDEWGD